MLFYKNILHWERHMRLIEPEVGKYKGIKRILVKSNTKTDKLRIPFNQEYNPDMVDLLRKNKFSTPLIEAIDNGRIKLPEVYSMSFYETKALQEKHQEKPLVQPQYNSYQERHPLMPKQVNKMPFNGNGKSPRPQKNVIVM